jgi:hypothetical protein
MRSLKTLVAVMLVLALGACAKPPQADIDAARAAVASAAKNADVVAYAADALKAAQGTLAQMETELSAKHYDKVKTLAVDAKAMAESAIKNAAGNKEKTRADASTLIAALKRALPGADQKMAGAKRVRGIKLDFTSLARQLADAKATVADADRDLGAGNFAEALRKASAAQAQLNDGEKTVTDAVQAASSRKK